MADGPGGAVATYILRSRTSTKIHLITYCISHVKIERLQLKPSTTLHNLASTRSYKTIQVRIRGQRQERDTMDIIIVGAGIAGLSVRLHHPFERLMLHCSIPRPETDMIPQDGSRPRPRRSAPPHYAPRVSSRPRRDWRRNPAHAAGRQVSLRLWITRCFASAFHHT